ncbi:properdin-like isoform X3 [Syngnathoides biaculeatus]|uniref:properdin-like isoform X3 n=1 Tax=Syngnathoides biaculeatus TaxID=300417 RepID=UPI002ADD6878|nr:properdin-like isoform X3 [Syngnathoides biaculeatus]
MKKVKRMLDIFVFSVVLGAEFAHAVTCFARLERSTGTCREELGDLDEDDCCLNTRYAYRTPDGDCQSCGPPTWSDWSPWSPCSTLCGEGVTQRSRKCFGFGQLECKNAADALQTKPCDGACCDEGWSSWLAWSPCSVTCGGGGVRTQERLCHAPPECLSACVGVSRMELRCDAPAGCPVHGGWSPWSSWSSCSSSCSYDDAVSPSRRRRRSCSSPAPSADTVPPGDRCHGDDMQVQDCGHIPKCPGAGLLRSGRPVGRVVASGNLLRPVRARPPISQQEVRSASAQTRRPILRGAERPKQRVLRHLRRCVLVLALAPARAHVHVHVTSRHVRSTVDGSWSGWANWGECSSSCIAEGGAPVRTRQRFCSSPAPSVYPRGDSCYGNRAARTHTHTHNWSPANDDRTPPVSVVVAGEGCRGDNRSSEACADLPHCAVDGAWGPWSSFSACPVTCGVGLEVSRRSCDSPAPERGGRPCPGDERRTRMCNTDVHCPVDGVWSEWSPWLKCKYLFRGRDIRCKHIGGSQSRERECLHRAHNGSICGGDDLSLSQYRACFDVNACYVKGSWGGWEAWSLCKPACGGNSQRSRNRICEPDYSDYRPAISRLKQPATFVGTPLLDCGEAPGGVTKEVWPCVNVPPCD